MNLRERPWLTIGVLVIVLMSAFSLHVERIVGWPFLILCTIVGVLGGYAAVSVRHHLTSSWERLPKSTRRNVIVGVVTVVLVLTFVLNRHRANEFVNDLIVVFGMLLLALYRVVSKTLDAIHERLFKR